MGICLDTEANITQQEVNDFTEREWKGGGVGGGVDGAVDYSGGGGGGNTAINQKSAASIRSQIQMQNIGKIKFDPPKVPVIFVLGGPGSGKVTHCDTLMQEKKGVIHINMMDLLQQYAIGNDMQDFSHLASKTVSEVLMLEMKMAPTAKAYLISGYPRSMRDVVEYTEKIQVVNGVVLISWRQAVLQKQIDYGAKLGHVVLSLAKMELENFFKNVMPVADYFDQSDILIAVNGERAPTDVYKDFRAAILEILGAQENQEALLNGVAGMGHGVNDIPGSIVSVETAPSQHKNITQPSNSPESKLRDINLLHPNNLMGQNVVTTVPGNNQQLPPILWVIGGPGSNKSTLCLKAIALQQGWGHFSIGRAVRSIAESDPKLHTENYAIKSAITDGEMISKNSIETLIDKHLQQLIDKKGIIMDGYPRNLQQVRDFESKYIQKPPVILLDCSKLQLGRGRLDDTVASFRRRLELFRELTLPMLKVLDEEGRLTIVDGDTDNAAVQKEFEKIVKHYAAKLGENQNNQNLYKNQNNSNNKTTTAVNGSINNLNQKQKKIHDLENVDLPPGVVPSTLNHHVSLMNDNINYNKKTFSSNNNNNNNNNSINNKDMKRNNIENQQKQQHDHHHQLHNNSTTIINNRNHNNNNNLITSSNTAAVAAVVDGHHQRKTIFRDMLEESAKFGEESYL